ncbi:MAG: hypothetical protein U1A23_04915 [Candidatus Sungbacteria bacterium]|nr:hypothetical protein [bacterium]MDZ4286244.1 hypothetical protein [Candidatus Sungbacteria bacterium]
MRRIFPVMCFAGACIVLLMGLAIACARSETFHAQEEIRRVEQLQVKANKMVRSIQYVKDARTDWPLCFAYYWGGGYDGGPALATVPCEAIPSHLLTTVAK